MVLRDASELHQLLAKEAMAVLAAVYVSVADHVRFIVRDRQVGVNSIVLVDVIVDCVVIRAKNHRLISSLGDLLVNILLKSVLKKRVREIGEIRLTLLAAHLSQSFPS